MEHMITNGRKLFMRSGLVFISHLKSIVLRYGFGDDRDHKANDRPQR